MALKFSLNLQSVAAQWMLCLLLAIAAVFAYQAKPWLAFMLLPEPMTQSQLKQVNDFESENPEATQVLHAYLGIRALMAEETLLLEQHAAWDDQDRDEGWAEATEYLLAHLAVTTTNNELRILDSECRNTLCQVKLMAPTPLTKEFTVKILDYAKVLKAGELEYEDLESLPGAVLLKLKANKRYKFDEATSAQLWPQERKQWEQELKTWYTK
ncbi:hypothetical protein [Rheinheimera tangshanensis]|jgi:hypothetical protein|uniref:Uncharacterized protein n=1 Tax=Rheinheimera tangshanensis TaxID=400153 RepID=A0A5C8M2U2_9GAMM|nr:hypothetical protein [Rheinheimera tangshanensis]TXK81710.1 hypothetical protein FU839_07365 [Rheinheimera tangshanensis]GGM55829.1 hypothetical protein GCM10010920_15370 [Rheinheimera tangshanensis]